MGVSVTWNIKLQTQFSLGDLYIRNIFVFLSYFFRSGTGTFWTRGTSRRSEWQVGFDWPTVDIFATFRPQGFVILPNDTDVGHLAGLLRL